MKPFNVYLSEVKGLPRAMVAKPSSSKDVDFAVDRLSESEKEMFMRLLLDDYLRMARDHARREEMLSALADASEAPQVPAPGKTEEMSAVPTEPKKDGRGGRREKLSAARLDGIRAFVMEHDEISTPMVLAENRAWTMCAVRRVLGQLVSDGAYTMEKRGKGNKQANWYIRVKNAEPVAGPVCTVPVQPAVAKPDKPMVTKESIMACKEVMHALLREIWERTLRGEYIGLHDAKDVVMAELKRTIPDIESAYDTAGLCAELKQLMNSLCYTSMGGFGPLLRPHTEPGQPGGTMFEARNSNMKAFAKSKGWKY